MYIHSDKLYCSRCKTFTGPFMKYSKRKTVSGKIKQYYHCRPCNTELSKTYRKNGGMKNFIEANKRFEKKNPEKRRAWSIAGKIPLEPCEVCGTKKRVHRHHDDYSKPLDVRFLCPAHHKEHHARNRPRHFRTP